MSKLVDGIERKCKQTGKTPFLKKKADSRANRWKPDERGIWRSYKCAYGNHWHLGHAPLLKEPINAK